MVDTDIGAIAVRQSYHDSLVIKPCTKGCQNPGELVTGEKRSYFESWCHVSVEK